MVRRENWSNFKIEISETGEAPPTKIGTHVLHINPYLHKFFDPILRDSIFSLPWTIVHGRKGKFSQNISETGEAPPTKIGTHVLHINPYLHKVFEPILSDSIFSLPWTIVHGPKGKFGQILK